MADLILANPYSDHKKLASHRLRISPNLPIIRLDAKLLAQLRRADMIAESYVPPDDIRELRSLVRDRRRLVDNRTDFKNEVHSLLNKEGVS